MSAGASCHASHWHSISAVVFVHVASEVPGHPQPVGQFSPYGIVMLVQFPVERTFSGCPPSYLRKHEMSPTTFSSADKDKPLQPTFDSTAPILATRSGLGLIEQPENLSGYEYTSAAGCPLSSVSHLELMAVSIGQSSFPAIQKYLFHWSPSLTTSFTEYCLISWDGDGSQQTLLLGTVPAPASLPLKQERSRTGTIIGF